MMNKRLELNETMMELVTGGTWGDNTYDDQVYNMVGIQVKKNYVLKDEFTLPDGSTTDMSGADNYIAERYTIDIIKNNGKIYYISVYDKNTGSLLTKFQRNLYS